MSMANTMKRGLLVLALALACGLAFSMTVAVGAAQAKEGYTYTVRVWAGNDGTVNGEKEYAELTGIEYGTAMKLSDNFKVKVTNDKYYHKGFRLSGTDNQNDDGSSNLRDAITVTDDLDYVVSYGVKGDMVEYTLHYVEYNNKSNVLAKSQTRIGRVGDRPVAAYEYIDGYRPRYENLVGTLKKSGNDWYFYYIKESSGSTTTTTTTGGGTTGGTTGGGTAAGGTAAGGTAAGGTAAGGTAAGTNEGGNAEGGNAAQTGTEDQTPPPTEEIGDVDNPLADGSGGDSSAGSDGSGTSTGSNGTGSSTGSDNTGTSSASNSEPPYGLIFGIALVLVAIVGGVLYYLRTRRE